MTIKPFSFDKLAEFSEKIGKDSEIMKLAEALSQMREKANEEAFQKHAEDITEQVLIGVAAMLEKTAELTADFLLEKLGDSLLSGEGAAVAPVTASPKDTVGEGSEDGKKPVITAEEIRGGVEEVVNDPNQDTVTVVPAIIKSVAEVNGPEHAPAAAGIAAEVIRQGVENKVVTDEEAATAASNIDQVVAEVTGA